MFVGDLAFGVKGQAFFAGFAAQGALERRLDAGLAQPVILGIPLVLELLIFVRVDRADRADQLRQQRGVFILALFSLTIATVSWLTSSANV